MASQSITLNGPLNAGDTLTLTVPVQSTTATATTTSSPPANWPVNIPFPVPTGFTVLLPGDGNSFKTPDGVVWSIANDVTPTSGHTIRDGQVWNVGIALVLRQSDGSVFLNQVLSLSSTVWEQWGANAFAGAPVPSPFDSGSTTGTVSGTTTTTTAPSLVSTGPSQVSDIIVTLSGGPFPTPTVFSGSAAIDRGDYVGPFVRQKAYTVKNTSFPDWTIWIRVDIDATGNRILEPNSGWRDEVIVEYGRSSNGTPSNVETAYTLSITKKGNPVTGFLGVSPFNGTASIPRHWWYSRYRYMSSKRPVVRTPATLMTNQWLPPFGVDGLFGATAPPVASWLTGPMTTPIGDGFEVHMGVAGDNPQIGLLTEYAADYVINGTQTSLISSMIEGEWVGNWSFHLRDDGLLSIPDAISGRLGFKSDGGTLNDVLGSGDPDWVTVGDSNSLAHFYPCSTLPCFLTDDPYLLEEMQFGSNLLILANFYHRNDKRLWGLPGISQEREFAWAIREIVRTYIATPTTVPSWLRSQSYWLSSLADSLSYLGKFMSSQHRYHSLFRAFGTLNDDWMASWLCVSLGECVQKSVPGFDAAFNWLIQNHIQKTNGTSGWPRGFPYAYEWFARTDGGNLAGGNNLNAKGNPGGWPYFTYSPWRSSQAYAFDDQVSSAGNVYRCIATMGISGSTPPSGTASSIQDGTVIWSYIDMDIDPITPADYSALWTFFKAGSLAPGTTTPAWTPIVDDTGWDGTAIMNVPPHPYANTGPSYFFHLRAALVMAVVLGVPGADVIYSWYQDQMVKTVIPAYVNVPGQARFSLFAISGISLAQTDLMAQQASMLSPGQWSGNLVKASGGRRYQDLPFVVLGAANFDSYYYHGTTIVHPNGTTPFAFSSGVFLSDRNKYLFTGGGHSDWVGSEVQLFDFPTLSWQFTDDSGQVDIVQDTTAPFQTTGNTDGNGNSWFSWPNKNGRHTTISQHSYAGLVYMKELGLVQANGAAAFPTGNGSPGGAMTIHADTGHWEEPPLHAASGVIGLSIRAEWIPDCKLVGGGTARRVFKIWDNGGHPQAFLWDPANPATAAEPAGNFFSAFEGNLAGAIVPDPINAGFRAFISLASGSPTTQAFVAQKIDLSGPNPNLNFVYQPYANTGPTLGGQTVFIYMGNDRLGSNQVVVFDPLNAGQFYLLDVTVGAAWGTWSGPFPLSGAPPDTSFETTNNNGVWKKFFYHPTYDGFFYMTGGTAAASPGDFFFFKRPTQVI